MIWATWLLAAALLVKPDTSRIRAVGRTALPISSPRLTGKTDDALAAASTFDLLAACLRSGMAVSAAAAATAPSAPPALARLLTRAADLLALGAEPATAWSSSGLPAGEHEEALLRMARRSASSGAALAEGVADLAVQVRHRAATDADAAAERASVVIAGPLGLCYLPAFVCLGIVPVVAGLAGDVLRSGPL